MEARSNCMHSAQISALRKLCSRRRKSTGVIAGETRRSPAATLGAADRNIGAAVLGSRVALLTWLSRQGGPRLNYFKASCLVSSQSRIAEDAAREGILRTGN